MILLRIAKGLLLVMALHVTCTVLTLPVLFLVALIAGCAGPELHGNARGGIIHWAGTTQAEVWQAANAHCAKHRKSARITSFEARAGGRVVFECA